MTTVHKKKYVQTSTDTVDYHTGEITHQTKTTVIPFEQEPPFVKLYFQDIAKITGLSMGQTDLLFHIVKNMSYKNIWVAHAYLKEIICMDLGMKLNTLNKYIDFLYKKGILLRLKRGVYLVNPDLFAKGSWKDIKKLRLSIEYDPKTGKRQVRSDLKKQLRLPE